MSGYAHGDERTIEVGGRELAAKLWGPAHGPPVLALHGWLDNAGSFDLLAPLLADLRVVALDLPGHGLSAHRSAGSVYHFVDHVADVIATADSLGWDRFALLGHSMGAGVSSLVAGVVPQRVTRMGLIEGLGPLSEPAEAAPRRLAQSIQDERSSAEKRTHPTREAAAERLVTASTSKLSIASAMILLERGLAEVPGGFAWRSDSRLRVSSRVRLTEEQVHAFLRAVSCPTLLVRARDGWPFLESVMSERAACLPDAELVEVAGGHHVHLDDPAEVADVLRPFFAPLCAEAG